MRYLFLFILSFSLSAECLPKNEGITCKNMPCINHIVTMSKGAVVVGICNKIYTKVKNEWVYDYTSIMTIGQIGRQLFSFENRVYDLIKE